MAKYPIDMVDRLSCYNNCPFVKKGNIIRPCADEVYEKGSFCLANIQKDAILRQFENPTVSASMNNLINHQAEVFCGKKLVAIIDRGVVTTQS